MENTYDRRKIFRQLATKDQIEMLYEQHENFLREWARDKKQIADLNQMVTNLQGELQGVAHRKASQIFNTDDKIKAALSQSTGVRFWEWYRPILSGTLTAVQTIIILAILALAFGVKVP